MSPGTRKPAVAGMFYPEKPKILHRDIQTYLHKAGQQQHQQPKAIVAPHAGYIYSGPIAATVYAQLTSVRDVIQKVILLGPSHRVAFYGMAIPEAAWFETPLGKIPLDKPLMAQIQDIPGVVLSNQAHAQEHSLEVHLPFLQEILSSFTLLPIVVGDASPKQVATLLDFVWGGPETLIVVSSDLSHYLPYSTAQQRDQHTSEAIESFDYQSITGEDACGKNPMNGLLLLAQQKSMEVKTLDLRNSGDTAGDRNRVVGYGAYAFY